MILQDVKSYVAARGRVSVDDLETRFHLDADTLRGMLDHWVAKGKVRKVEGVCGNGNCGKCDARHAVVYEWAE